MHLARHMWARRTAAAAWSVVISVQILGSGICDVGYAHALLSEGSGQVGTVNIGTL